MRTAVADGIGFADAVIDVVTGGTRCRLAGAGGGAFHSRAVADVRRGACFAVCAAVGVVVGFAGAVVVVIAGGAGSERADTFEAFGRAVGGCALVSVRTAVGDGVGFASVVVDVVIGVAADELAGLVFTGTRTVCVCALGVVRSW